jgi:antitoxin component YwqK of YwqJK toxin-antitoxin module
MKQMKPQIAAAVMLFIIGFFVCAGAWAGELAVYEAYYPDKPEQLRERFTYDKDIGPENGKQGLYESWHCNGALYIHANYNSGKLQGLYTEYYDNNSKQIECNYEAGERHGAYKGWYSNGLVLIETAYNYGKLHGIKTEYGTAGQKLSEETYTNGVLNGAFKKWNSAGQLTIQATYKNGLWDGMVTTYKYFPNETEKLETSYVNGKKHGLEKFWVTMESRTFLSWIKEYSDDLLIKEMESDGSLSREYAYDENGNMIKKIEYGWINDNTSEWRYYYDANGIVFRVTNIHWWGIAVAVGGTANVMMKEEDCYYANEVLTHGNVIHWHENGKMSSKYTLDENKKMHGSYT